MNKGTPTFSKDQYFKSVRILAIELAAELGILVEGKTVETILQEIKSKLKSMRENFDLIRMCK